jgi:hypothetical protein
MAKPQKASHTDATTISSAPKAAEPSISDGFLKIGNDDLARKVIEGVKQAKVTAKELTELRKRFAALKKNETIIGYGKGRWQKFCLEKLMMSPQTAREWIRVTCEKEGVPTPGSNHDGSGNRAYGLAPWFHVPCGKPVDQARSSMHKAIRDGDEVCAGWWLNQLFFAGDNIPKALSVYTNEDVGLADLTVKTHVLEWLALAKECPNAHKPKPECLRDKCKQHPPLLCYMNAIQIICRAKKCRNADDACIFYRENQTWMPYSEEETQSLIANQKEPKIPDKALDCHTAAGRRMGRGMEHFIKEGAALSNKSDIVGFVPPAEMSCPHCNGTGRVKLPRCEEAD